MQETDDKHMYIYPSPTFLKDVLEPNNRQWQHLVVSIYIYVNCRTVLSNVYVNFVVCVEVLSEYPWQQHVHLSTINE